MGCLTGCIRFLFTSVWRLILAALIALLLARADEYIERRHGGSLAGRAWKTYRRRGKA